MCYELHFYTASSLQEVVNHTTHKNVNEHAFLALFLAFHKKCPILTQYNRNGYPVAPLWTMTTHL